MCIYCDKHLGHLHFYMVSKEPQFKSYDDVYDHVRSEMAQYHYEYGQYGFLSEHTDESYLSDHNVRQRAERIWDIDQNAKLKIEKAACCHITELDHLSKLPNFIKFL